MVNTRQKGMMLANWIADQIVAKGIDPKARADGASGAGNREKADISTSMRILGSNAGIEAKNQAVIHMSDWWKQTKKLEVLGCEPVLVYKEFGEPLEDSKAVIYLDTLLELIKNQKGNIERQYTDTRQRERDNAIEQIIQAVKVLEK